MTILLQRFLGRLDEASFGKLRVWEFSFRSLTREYAWLFLFKAIFGHPLKAARGICRYRRFIKSHENDVAQGTRPVSIPDDAVFFWPDRSCSGKNRPLIGLGFCLKPVDATDLSRTCPSGQANHDCLYLESGETRPVCAGCAIHEIGRSSLEAGCSVYIMTSARDIAGDFMIPQISRGSFPWAVLLLCPYSIRAIILPLLICGVEMLLLPYASGSCADYRQWLKADRGIKDERTTIDDVTRRRIHCLLEKLAGGEAPSAGGRHYLRFRRAGNIFIPTSG